MNAPPAKRVPAVRFWWMAWLETSITQFARPFDSISAKISMSTLFGGVV